MFSGARETNLTASNRRGTLVTASSTADTKGSWTELIASSSAAAEGIWVEIREVEATATDTSLLLDIGIGAAASETVLIANIAGGNASGIDPTSPDVGGCVFIPVSIASGTRISARTQGAVGSQTARIVVHLAQSVQDLNGASSAQTLGANTSTSQGVDVAPGVDSFGSWVEIGTLSGDANLFIPSLGLSADSTITAANETYHIVELGYGTAGSETAMGATWRFGANSGEGVSGPFPEMPVYQDLASGTRIVARIASGRTDAKDITVYAFEGVSTASGDRSVADGVKVGESNAGSRALSGSASNGTKVGDSATYPAGDTDRAVADGAKLGDAPQGARALSGSTSDGLVLGENFKTGITDDSGPDGIVLGDTASSASSQTRSASDGAKVGDPIGPLAGSAAASDGIKLGDIADTSDEVFPTDGVLVGMSLAVLVGLQVTITHGALLGDGAVYPSSFPGQGKGTGPRGRPWPRFFRDP